MYDLAERLNIHRLFAVGIMETFWHVAGKNAPRGDIGSYSNAAISELIGWPKKADALIKAMLESGWIDPHPEYRLVIHDWPEHCENSVHSLLKKKHWRFWDGSPPFHRSSSTVHEMSPTVHEQDVNETRPTREAKAKAMASGVLNSPETENLPSPKINDQSWAVLENLTRSVGMRGEEGPYGDWEKIQTITWPALSFEDQLAAVAGIRDRIENGEYGDPAFVPLLVNYFGKKLWRKPLRPKPKNKQTENERRRRELDEMTLEDLQNVD